MTLSKAVRLGLITIGIVCSSLTLLPSSVALTVNEVPNPRPGGWVSDMADLLDPEAEAQLNRLIERNEQEVGTEIAVVTVPTTVPAASPKAFALDLFNAWGIGKAERNNGILILISQSDRRTEVTLGTGIARTLSDEAIGKIIQTEMTPEFKRGDFGAGAIAGTEALIARSNSGAEAEAILIIMGGLGIAAMIWIGYKAASRPSKRKSIAVESVERETQDSQNLPSMPPPRPSASLLARSKALGRFGDQPPRRSSNSPSRKTASRRPRTRISSRYSRFPNDDRNSCGGSWDSHSSNDSGSFGGGGSDGDGAGDDW